MLYFGSLNAVGTVAETTLKPVPAIFVELKYDGRSEGCTPGKDMGNSDV